MFLQIQSENLSVQDIAGVQKAYPSDATQASLVALQNTETLKQLLAVQGISAVLKKSLNQRLELGD